MYHEEYHVYIVKAKRENLFHINITPGFPKLSLMWEIQIKIIEILTQRFNLKEFGSHGMTKHGNNNDTPKVSQDWNVLNNM